LDETGLSIITGCDIDLGASSFEQETTGELGATKRLLIPEIQKAEQRMITREFNVKAWTALVGQRFWQLGKKQTQNSSCANGFRQPLDGTDQFYISVLHT